MIKTVASEDFLAGTSGLPLLRYSRDQIIGTQIEAHLKRIKASLPNRFEFESKILGNKRQITVYKPHGYDQNHAYPVIYFNDGLPVIERGLVDRSLDNLIGTQIEPVLAVFIESDSYAEFGGKEKDDYCEMIVSELIPYIDQTYPTKKEASGRVIMGQDAAGFSAIYTALKFPNTFAWAGGQSTRVENRFGHQLKQVIQASTNNQTQIYMD